MVGEEKIMLNYDTWGNPHQHGPHRYQGHKPHAMAASWLATIAGSAITMTGTHDWSQFYWGTFSGKAYRSPNATNKVCCRAISSQAG